jgi:hypothetical protein
MPVESLDLCGGLWTIEQTLGHLQIKLTKEILCTLISLVISCTLLTCCILPEYRYSCKINRSQNQVNIDAAATTDRRACGVTSHDSTTLYSPFQTFTLGYTPYNRVYRPNSPGMNYSQTEISPFCTRSIVFLQLAASPPNVEKYTAESSVYCEVYHRVIGWCITH